MRANNETQMTRKAHMYRLSLVTILLMSVGTLVLGCADEQPPVNRVEAYALPKTLFQGEWYYHRTVVDVPAADSVSFHNQKGMLERIRWDIQENFVYARMSYEQIQNAKKANQDTGEYLGEIVGAWKIANHFDIKYAYNPTTGEEQNILEENARDCKWYDCKYMRVDWSRNYATDFLFLGTRQYIDIAMVKEQMPFSEQDASDPRYKPIFDVESGYIDVTTAQVIAPAEYYFRDWGVSIPLCYFYDDMNCESEVVKVRNSFWRRDPNRDYEPRNLRGSKDEWFGLIVHERFNYLEEQGLSYWAKQHFLVRHNLWEKSHIADKACKSDADCDAAAGSHCDTLIAFHSHDVVTDSDTDGLPDSFEEAVGLKKDKADSDGDGLLDAKDDGDDNGLRDLEDFYKWDGDNMEFRCTIPQKQREPVPVTYFLYNFPRSLVCDEHNNDPKKDSDPAPCKAWGYEGDAKKRDSLAALHYTQLDYDDTFFRVMLRGVHGWSDADYQKWVKTHSTDGFSADQAAVLGKFGDKEHGYYTFAMCPNNPVEDTDPWPCRFPRHSFAQAKELMDAGYTFNHLTYEQAKAALDAGKKPETSKPTYRLGDVRYHIVNFIDQYSPYRFVGVSMPSASVDRRTGEIISGTANLSSVLDTVVTRSQEKIDLLNGKVKPTEYVNGTDLAGWVNTANQQTGSRERWRTFGAPQLQSMYQSMSQDWMKNIPKLGTPEQFKEMRDSQGRPLSNKQLKRALLESFDRSGVLDPARTTMDISAVKGTQLEKKLINREVLALAGFAPGADSKATSQPLTADMISKASIARPEFMLRLRGETELRDNLIHELGMDFAEMTDDGLSSYAKRVKDMSPEQLWAEIRRIYATLVVTHELGHAIGLEHNFGGSEDAVNFPEEYWRVRTNDWQQTRNCSMTNTTTDMLCPLFVKAPTDYQLGIDPKNAADGVGGMYEYANTSIMEYQRNWVYHKALGRYDDAALMYGYANKVEVFKDTGKVPSGLGSEYEPNVFEEWWDSSGSVLMIYSNRAQGYHYTNWYPSMGRKLFEESNRKLVDGDAVVELRSSSGRSKGWYYVDDKTKETLVRVPYVYCTRTSSDLGDNCLSHDEGVDQYEKMKIFVDAWDTWYVLSAFPRQRLDQSSPWSYASRKYQRFYSRLKDFNNAYALYQSLFHQWYAQAQIDEFFSDALSGWGSYTVSMQDAFNVAMRTVMMPDVKYFGDKKTLDDGQVCYPESEFSTNQSSDLSNARYFSTEYYDTNYEQTCGYYWWECLHHIGFFIDKMLALNVLSDPRTYFVGQDTSEDIRQYRISFFNNFTDQIIDTFGGILSHDYAAVAPWYDPAKPGDRVVYDNKGQRWVNGVAWRNYALPSADPVKPAAGAPLEAGTRFTEQLYAAVYGMFEFQGNFNSEFIERGRLWKKGKGTAWTIKPTADIEGVSEFVDPNTGSTYAGIKYTDGRGIAQRMIKRANTLKGHTKYCTPAPPAPTPAPDDVCIPNSDQVRAEQELRSYRDLLDIMVQITSIYDAYGYNWSWNPYNP